MQLSFDVVYRRESANKVQSVNVCKEKAARTNQSEEKWADVLLANLDTQAVDFLTMVSKLKICADLFKMMSLLSYYT